MQAKDAHLSESEANTVDVTKSSVACRFAACFLLSALMACSTPPRSTAAPIGPEPTRSLLTSAATPTGIAIPSDLDRVRTLVQWLGGAGITVLSVQHSVEGSLFQSASQAAWIRTDIGIADAVFFLDPAGTVDLQVIPLQSQEAGRYLYRVQAPYPAMLNAVTIDAAYPLYFTIRPGMYIETSSEQLDEILRRLPIDSKETPEPKSLPLLPLMPTATTTDVPTAATRITHGTFTLGGEQAQEIALFRDLVRAYRNGQVGEAWALPSVAVEIRRVEP